MSHGIALLFDLTHFPQTKQGHLGVLDSLGPGQGWMSPHDRKLISLPILTSSHDDRWAAWLLREGGGEDRQCQQHGIWLPSASQQQFIPRAGLLGWWGRYNRPHPSSSPCSNSCPVLLEKYSHDDCLILPFVVFLSF